MAHIASKWILACLGAIACLSTAQAARPLTVDDTGVNEVGTCQLEAWRDHEHGSRHVHAAPTCGVLPGLELNLEVVRSSPASEHAQGRFLGFRWIPEAAQWAGWQFGLRGGWLQEKPPAEKGWQSGNWSAAVMASRPLSDSVTLLLNVGHTHLTDQQQTLTTHGLALMWNVSQRWMLYAEVLGDTRHTVQKGMGVRFWVIPEVLGLDLTGMRTDSRPDSRVWGVGFGWYGIKF